MSAFTSLELQQHEPGNYASSNTPKEIILQDWRLEEFPYRIHKMCEQAGKVLLTGSAYICKGTGITPGDIDIMLLVADYGYFITNYMKGAKSCSKEDVTEQNNFKFQAFRDGIFNILITDSEVYFDRWALATHIAKQLKLTKKQDRVILFEHIRSDYVITPQPELKPF